MGPCSTVTLALVLALSHPSWARRARASRLEAVEGELERDDAPPQEQESSFEQEDSFLEEDADAEDGSAGAPKPKFDLTKFKMLAEPLYTSSDQGHCGEPLLVTKVLDYPNLNTLVKTGLHNHLKAYTKMDAWKASAKVRSITSSKQFDKQKPRWTLPDGPGDYVTTRTHTSVNDNVKRANGFADMKTNTWVHVAETFPMEPDRVRARIDSPHEGYISLKDVTNGGRWATSKKEHGPKYHSTAFFETTTGISEGLLLVRAKVGDRFLEGPFDDDSQLFQILIDTSLRDDGTVVELSFVSGVNLRSCWGELVGLDDGEPVCSDNIMQALHSELAAKQQVSENKAGNSGSSIFILSKFVIKSAAHGVEYATLPDVFARLHQGISEQYERLGGCWSTGLTPICGALIDPGNGYWLVTRNIDVQGLADRPLDNGDYAVDYFDIKSPYFVGLVDGKTHLNKAGVWGDDPNTWKNKDPGFCSKFPEGVPIEACGARDATATLVSDAAVLRGLHMTDYSLFVKLKHAKKGTKDWCPCDAATKPYFPMIVQARAQTWGVKDIKVLGKGITFAVAIIDYLERKVSSMPMSTMKPPNEYQDHWKRIMTSYFRIPPREANGDVVTATNHEQAEKMAIGTRVFSLQRVKFRAKIASKKTVWSDDIVQVIGEYAKEYYIEQAEEHAACSEIEQQAVWGVNPLGLDRYWNLVPPGAEGELVNVAKNSLAVHFFNVPKSPNNIVFNMRPGQVMEVRREFA